MVGRWVVSGSGGGAGKEKGRVMEEEELAEGRGKWRREEGSSGGRYGVAERLGKKGRSSRRGR